LVSSGPNTLFAYAKAGVFMYRRIAIPAKRNIVFLADFISSSFPAILIICLYDTAHLFKKIE
jgi:hypothetical protein